MEESGLVGRPDQTPVDHPAGLLLLEGHSIIVLGGCSSLLLRVGTLALKSWEFSISFTNLTFVGAALLSPQTWASLDQVSSGQKHPIEVHMSHFFPLFAVHFCSLESLKMLGVPDDDILASPVVFLTFANLIS